MNFYEIKRKDSEVYPAILLDRIFNSRTRRKIRSALFYAIATCFFFIILSFINIESLKPFTDLRFFFRSFFILIFSVWFTFYLFELMYLSYYFRETQIDFDVLKLVNNSDSKDITKSFLESDIGTYAMIRLGIDNEDIKNFLKNRKDFVTEAEYEILENKNGGITFSEFAFSLLHFDSDFSKFLKTKGVTAKDLKQTLDWISRMNRRMKDEYRWWTKERLNRIPSFGKNWAFGQIYYLEKFGHSIYSDTSYFQLGDKHRIYKDTVNKVENVLAKDFGANVILTARESDIAMNVVSSLGKEIILGTTLPELENKRIYVLDINSFTSSFEEKTGLERMLQRILYQAAGAGNLILVIPHLSDFVENVSGLDIDVKDILGEIMSSTKLQVIALSSNKGFHETLETDLDLMKNFEKITLEDLDQNSALEMIEDEALYIESKENILFTFQALQRVVESADRYFSDGTISDKTVDILNEVSGYCVSNNIKIIKEEYISKIVEDKTGVPLGVLSHSEKEKLSKVEMLLKQRVIGQDRAIEAISEAMKRARLGVANPKRPLGSFLFIGPTGVGKTETSKALAEVFFGDDEDMIRIDMTEYNDSSSVEKLIGDRDNPGILSSKIRENQYGVLLLDEFEKAHPDVHNLFLQILDEGIFSDGNGEQVNARNLIIIATSNAGSDLMYRAIDKNVNLQSIKEKIIGHLIDNKLFRPEFLNRFDEVVLFNSLNKNTLEVIVSLMIQKLNKRLEDKGLDVLVNDELTAYLVEKGNNEKFGAREINRVIQKEIEAKIANALINGTISNGDTISFKRLGDEIEIQK